MEREEVLTEEESEALLEGVRDGSVATDGEPAAPGGIRDVDLTQWDRIVRGRVPALESINERLVGLMRLGMFQLFHRPVEISGEPVQMVKWGDYVNSLPMPTSLNLIRAEEQDTALLVMLDADLVFEFVDAYFGGRGGAGRKPGSAEFTPTERRLTRNVVRRVVTDMKEAWSAFLHIDFAYLRAESNPQFAAVAAPSDPVYVSRFRIELAGHGGDFHVVLPSPLVDPIRHFTNVGSPTERVQSKDFWLSALREDVCDAPVALRTVLAETTLSLGELVDLNAGDIIPIELPSTVRVLAGDSVVLEGTFGVSRGYNAVKVIHTADADRDNGSIAND